jgi:hypothetical protein
MQPGRANRFKSSPDYRLRAFHSCPSREAPAMLAALESRQNIVLCCVRRIVANTSFKCFFLTCVRL